MEMVKNFNTTLNWVDITDEFKNAAQQLHLGQLVHDELFGLFDAMAAIELMDPKMDAGMMCNKQKKVLSFEEQVANSLIKVANFTAKELIGIIDDTYSCLVTWLEGHSLAQTVFINIYLHNPSLIVDKRLRAFCVTMLKIVDTINDFVLQASVYEEEDFQPKTFNFQLATELSYSKVRALIKVAEDEISKEIIQLQLQPPSSYNNNDDNDEVDLLKALLVRFVFTKNFYAGLNHFKKQVSAQHPQSQPEMSLLNFLPIMQQYLISCEDACKQWISTVDYGIQPDESKIDDESAASNNKTNYPTIIGFEPLINQRLLPPSFPRYSKMRPRLDTVNYLIGLLGRLKKLLIISDLHKFGDVIKFFNDFSKLIPSCVVSRSMLQLFYLPASALILGEQTIVKVIKDSCKQFIKPPALSAELQLDKGTKEILDDFFSRCLIPFKNIIHTYGHNRARQREKIAIVLKDFVCIMDESVSLDRFLNLKLESNHRATGYLQFWVLFYKLSLTSQYLLSGFELELYSSHEYAYMFMELDYIWDYIALLLKRAADIYLGRLQASQLEELQTNNKINRKKAAKQSHKNKTAAKLMHEQEMHYYRGLSQLAGAMHRIFLAFTFEGKLNQPTGDLNTERIRFEHRFEPLARFEAGILSYDKYKEKVDLYRSQTNATSQLYSDAIVLMSQARAELEAIKGTVLQEEVHPYIKVAKTNMVVINLLLSGHNTQAMPDFQFSETPYFPIIKFCKSN